MAETGTKPPRERYRVQVRTEIKERAWEQIATTGASALSPNAIAKQSERCNTHTSCQGFPDGLRCQGHPDA